MEDRYHAANRGVSEIIGAILVFGLVVVSLSLFQTTAVPASNEQVEFDHNQRVQTELLGLDAELSDAAATGNGGTTIVTVGMDYPTRFLFRNPPPVSGTLSTAESGFTIENAEAVGDTETDDYWDGTTPRPYTSRQVVYRVDYNVYQSAPTTVLSHGVVYDRFPDGTTRRIDAGGFIDGRSIELAGLDGRLGESRVGALSVPVSAQSAPTETVRVRDDPEVDDDNIRLTVRTDASADAWESFLEDQLISEGGHVETVLGPDDDDTVAPGTVAVVLEEDVTYDLELARVAVDPAPYDPEPAYVTTVGDTTVDAGTEVTVEVRDRYNGPVAGAAVRFTEGDSVTTVQTGAEGRATFEPSSAGRVTAAVADGSDDPDDVGDPLNVVYDVEAMAGPGDGGGDGTETINRADRGIKYTSATVEGRNRFVVDFERIGDSGAYTIKEARISFVSYETQGGNVIRKVTAIEQAGSDENIIEDDESLEVAGEFRELNPNGDPPGVVVDGSSPTTLTFEFDGEFGTGASRQEFFVVSLLIDGRNGAQYQTFFVGKTPPAEEDGPNGGDGPGQGRGPN